MTLSFKGERVGAVYSLDRTRGTADVALERSGTSRVPLAELRSGSGRHAVDLAAVRREVEGRSGISFGEWPKPEGSEDVSEQVKHSPGPWSVRPDANDDWGIVRAADGLAVADAGVFARCADMRNRDDEDVTPAEWAAGPPEVAANARLIAASPDLFAACVALVAAVDAWGISPAKAKEAAELARLAVARVRGEPEPAETAPEDVAVFEVGAPVIEKECPQ